MTLSTIIALLVFPVIFIYFLISRKNPYENLSYSVRNGDKCYICGDDFDNGGFIRIDANPRLCTSCKRDYSINDVQNVSNLHTRLLYFFYSPSSSKVQKMLLFSMIGLLEIGRAHV